MKHVWKIGLFVSWLLLAGAVPGDAEIKAVVRFVRFQFDGTTIIVSVNITLPDGKSETVGDAFVAASVPGVTNILPALKTRVKTYATTRGFAGLTDSEIAVLGAPQ